MSLRLSPLLRTDSYKHSHFVQYPEGTTRVHSYIEARGGKYPEILFLVYRCFSRDIYYLL